MSNPSQLTPLKTSRLCLRPTHKEDIPILHQKIFCDPEVTLYTLETPPKTIKESEAYVYKHFSFDENTPGMYPIIELTTHALIGYGGILPCNFLGKNEYEFGFVFAKEHWGKGFATEIGKAQIMHVFNTTNQDRILATTAPNNQGSIKVLTKLGLQFTKQIHNENRGTRDVYAVNRKTFLRTINTE